MGIRRIRPARRRLDDRVRAAPSKSVTHRALVAAALARGASRIRDPLDADDTRATRDGLISLGLPIRVEPGAWIVEGRAGEPRGGGSLELGESGTSMRFLTAVAALGHEPSTLDGAPRLRQRPLGELVQALRSIGGLVRPGPGGGLPLQTGGQQPVGGAVRLPAQRSSQFASAMLLIGPRLREGVQLTLEGRVVSMPYIELTVDVLSQFGVQVEQRSPSSWLVRPTDYEGRDITVEGDHSSASYFLAAAAIVGGRMRVEGLRGDSAQADAVFGEMLERVGCRVFRGDDYVEVEGTGRIDRFDLDLGRAPDLVPTLAILALFADGPCTVRGVAHLRFKESDRLEVLSANLSALGREASAFEDRLEIGPPPAALRPATIKTASDHRMAMAFAVAGLRLDGVELDDPTCVAKSNPRFWDDFERLEGQSRAP